MATAETIIGREAPSVFLLASDFNEDAQAFYRRLGYQQVGAIPDYVVPGITELIYPSARRRVQVLQAVMVRL